MTDPIPVDAGQTTDVSVTMPPPAPAPAYIPPATPEPVEEEAPASPLAGLRARREKLKEALYLDLKVPRWDDDGGPSIYVRLAPADPGFMNKIVKRAERAKVKADDWMVEVNADALIKSCLGVFAIEDDVSPADAERKQMLSLRDGDPHGEWTRFDSDLGESLGLDGVTGGRAVCRALYFTSGDLLAAANKLAEWSGRTAPEADEDFSGA